MAETKVLEHILELARWAPSGDNTQPWRFEIIDQHHFVVHGFDTRADCVYDLDGHPSQISLGTLLESISLAASTHGLNAQFARRPNMADDHPTFDVALKPVANAMGAIGAGGDPLAAFLRTRSVQRRPLSTRALSAPEKETLLSSLPAGYRVLWLEGRPARLEAARLMSRNAKLRLTMPEAYRVHSSVIEWKAQYSEDRIPDQALGVDPMTARLMRWIMRSWSRVAFFNTWLGGTVAPRLQMDYLPALACGAHFVLVAGQPPRSVDDYVAAGRAVQRFWLCATQLGLQLQPELTPLIFARYVREGRRFSTTAGMQESAKAVTQDLEKLIGAETSVNAVFMGRIGEGNAAKSRSTRRPLAALLMAALRK